MREPHRERVAELQHRMAEAGIDAVALDDADSIYYLTGYWGYMAMEFGRPTIVVVSRHDGPALITPAPEAEMAAQMTGLDNMHIWSDGPDREWRGMLGRLVPSAADARLGIELDKIHPVVIRALRENEPRPALVDIAPTLGAMRAIKSPEEIAVMRQAGQVAVAMVEAARERIAEGVPEYEVALAVIAGGTRKAAEILEAEDTDRLFSPTIYNLQAMQSGRETCMVHRRSTVRRLEVGDPVYLCFCGIANFKQFKLGFDREFFVGSATDEHVRLYETAVRAQQAALAEIRAGVRAEDVHAAAEEIYRAAGFGVAYRTGRAIGYSFLESPELKRGDETRLVPGMTFAVDGGITVPGRFGARVGDSVVVTDDGFEYFTDYPRELTVL